MECDYIEKFENIKVYYYNLILSCESIFIYFQANDIDTYLFIEDIKR